MDDTSIFYRIKQAAAGRCGEIIAALTPLPADVVTKGRSDHPCPVCDGQTVIWPDDRDGGANQHGRIACRNCTGDKPTGDIIAAVAAFNGLTQGEAARQIKEYLGLSVAEALRGQKPEIDIVAAVAKAKHMPVDAFRLFGAEPATRGRSRKAVARVPIHDGDGKQHSYFDLTETGKGWCKRGKGNSGMFFPGKLPQAGETWLVVEGVKDAAALVGLGHNACGLPSSYMAAKYANLFQGVHVVTVADLDTAGQHGAQKTGGNLEGIAASVKAARLPGEIVASGGDDVRDVIRRQGADAVRKAIDGAQPWQPRDGEQRKGEKPEVMLSLNQSMCCDLVTRHLGQLGWETPWIPEQKRERRKIYQRGGLLVQVVDEVSTDATLQRGKVAIAKGTPRIRTLPSQQLPLRIGDACGLLSEKVKGDEVEIERVPPPRWLSEGIYTAGDYGSEIRPLEGIITAPTIRSDGSILQLPGWDQDTGLLHRPSQEFPEVPEKPAKADAACAASKLVSIVSDFPFFDDADRAGWLAMVLSMIGRPCIAGHVPLFAVTANIRGAGKSLLVDVASVIAYGHSAARTTYASDDDEMRKRITAIAIEGSPAVLLDNIDRPMGGAALDAALTAERWKDRELGNSRNVDLPLRTVWAATGNNLLFRSDIARRVLPIRLDSPLEKPEERTGFQHPDLFGWIQTHRGEIVTAALSILRAYFVAGCPIQAGGTFGSFESWSDIIRGAVVWAGMADPLSSRETADADDQSFAVVRGLIGGLLEVDGTGNGMTCREIVAELKADFNAERFTTLREVVAEVATTKGAPNAKSLGYALRKYRGRVSGGFQITGEPDRNGVIRWKAKRRSTAGDAGHAGHVSPHLTREAVVSHTPCDTTRTYRSGGESCPSSPASPAPTGSEVDV